VENKFIFRARFVRWLVCTCALILAGCGISPPPVDEYQVSISQDVSAHPSAIPGWYQVSGGPGSVPADSTVKITNFTTFKEFVVTANHDGSFTAQVEASAGDRLQIIVYQGVNSSPPTYVFVAGLNIKNPYTRGGYWHVGQTHFHTTNSDGVNTPAQMEIGYKNAGYDFLVSTDHRGTLPHFVDEDDGMTPDPDNSATGRDLLWIRGNEFGFGSVHMGAWGQEVQTPMLAGDSPADIQWRIDHVRANRGLAVINHPHNEAGPYAWDWGDETLKVRRYSFVEAFNGKHSLVDNLSTAIDHTPTAVDLADDYQQVWWIGTDDCHDMNDSLQFDRYAIVVQTDGPAITKKDILASADAGNMYIRQTAFGPAITSANVDGNKIVLKMADVDSLYDVIWKKRGDEIIRTDRDVDTTVSYTVAGNEGYVRAEIRRNDDGKYAYTQPFFIANNVDLSSSVSVSSGSGAGNLIDNNRSTYWDAQANTASFVVDVGGVRLVNAIKIDWYAADSRRFNYRVETSETGAFTGEQKEVVRETYHNRLATTLDFFDEATRYVRVTVTSQSVGVGDAVRINEVQVFDASPSRSQLYIDNVAGNDMNSGLADNPWRTFSHARSRMRPRDTLNFLNTGVPYTERMDLNIKHGGKHRYATVMYKGDPKNLMELNAAGLNSGVFFNGSSFVEWMHFDVHSSSMANILIAEGSSEISIMYNRLHGGLDKGFLGAGKFLFAYNLVYANANEGALVYRNGTNATIYNNVFHGNGKHGLQFSSTVYATPLVAQVMNNIFSGNASAAMVRGSVGSIVDGYNCVEGAYIGTWQRTGNLDVSPRFVSPETADFRLQAASPCIDAGIDVGLSKDFQGNAPHDAFSVANTGNPGGHGRDYVDIGAHEYID
jgi:hypothetical protein